MSGGFNNPLVGGGGALVYPSIHSPNFSEVAETGWSIDKNGNAFFFSITIQGGTFVLFGSGTGLFMYSGTPAFGNLILSIAPDSGMDQFGNPYPQGMGLGTINNDIIQLRPDLNAMILYGS